MLSRPRPDLGDTSYNALIYFRTGLKFGGPDGRGGAVLVHCYHGVSRSAAIVTAYLMRSVVEGHN